MAIFKIGGKLIKWGTVIKRWSVVTVDGLDYSVSLINGGVLDLQSNQIVEVNDLEGWIVFNTPTRIKELRLYSGFDFDLSLVAGLNNLTHLRTESVVPVHGDILNLPANLEDLVLISTSNTTTGDVVNLPRTLTRYYSLGQNTVFGNVADLPRTLTSLTTQGNCTITGNVSGLPSGLTYLRLRGKETVFGNFADLPRGLTYYWVDSVPVIEGNVADLPRGIATFLYYGNGGRNIYGNVADLPTSIYDMRLFFCSGLNLYGNFRNAPSSLYRIWNYLGAALNITYDGTGRLWGVTFNQQIGAVSNYDSQMLENHLVDLSQNVGSSGTRYLELATGGVTITTTAQNALNTLTAAGATITIS